MGIPESQLDTWSHQGSVTQSAATYNAIKSALESTSAAYHSKDFKVYLQGSYGNDTNIFAESDVDVVIQLDDVYFSDVNLLTPTDKAAYDQAFVPATYSYDQYRNDVVRALTGRFGADVRSGHKAIVIAANGNRRKADVIAAMQFRRYREFRSAYDSTYDEGICFFTLDGQQIVNYPKQHSKNLTIKHQASNAWLKPMIRVLKNMRRKLVADGVLSADVAPSYYLEGLLYNVPSEKFGLSYGDCFVNAINWIQSEGDKSKLVCANEQYYLLWEGSPTSWEPANAEALLQAVIKQWNEW
ncbi:nucleotidyltransferase [Pseudomonas mosselii]|uniref:nucleotidyltransferase domain-containing protein n=1 Tax=Pseudomonas mosselii TaxID=78327 RepID=UPI002447AF09|nr:nucleotidyltransferase [Pseudomonas mosselii]MDH1145241.1 nucleotidyltransferase [Pseudomonas mosselii]